jgi:hypothetical protein
MSVGVLLWYWWRGIFNSPRARGLAFSLGVMAYLIFMPFTFKYSILFAVIPVIFLLMDTSRWWTRYSLLFSALTLSLPAKDIVGDTIFFSLQFASIPAIALIFLSFAVIRELMRETQ